MFYIREVRTSSGATAVQVVRYQKRKRIVEAHIGSGRTKEEFASLRISAQDWIDRANVKQLSLFPEIFNGYQQDSESVIVLSKCKSVGFRYQVLYNCLWNLTVKFKFHLLNANILNDLVIARIVEPCSKLESLKFIDDFFGIKHHRSKLYRYLPDFKGYKDDIEAKIISVARKHFSFNFSLVFYDLTTLYFESQKDDDGGLRKIGFSKDNKSSNPQIMIGLLVNNLGFPVSYQIFPGNKFEGHTLLPSIITLKKKHKIKNMTVVADSAMISDDNISLLTAENLSYIVAARTANLPMKTIEEVSKQLSGQDEATIRIPTENKGNLILHFSKQRYLKEKREMDKQLDKANFYLKHPSAAEIIKRTKFLRGKKLGYELNQELIHKTTLLLGIKGYHTNIDQTILNDQEIIQHYKNLWQVEKAFRISKSDLKARPIFHSKQQAIETHLLICFMALAISKYIEIKTSKSIRSVIKELKGAIDAIIYNEISKKEIVIKAEVNDRIKEILNKIV